MASGQAAVYLDSNATTPLDARVLAAIHDTLSEAWGNPSSTHPAGRCARQAVDTARAQVAAMLGAAPTDIVFTSGGTEANALVLHTATEHYRRWWKEAAEEAAARPESGLANVPHIVTSTLEHDSIALPLRAMQQRGDIELSIVAADPVTAAVTPAAVVAALQPNTVLVTLMLANNETGALQPIRDISAQLRAARADAPPSSPPLLIHTDAAQALGKIPVDVQALGVDYLTVVGHKFYAPRIGALYVRNCCTPASVPVLPMFLGGGQERGIRAGTENTGMIAGLGMACAIVTAELDTIAAHFADVRDYLEQQLKGKLGKDVIVNAESASRLPNTCNFSILNRASHVTGRSILAKMEGVWASVGAACHSDSGDRPSPILVASGVPESVARTALRWSIGRGTTREDIDVAVHQLLKSLAMQD